MAIARALVNRPQIILADEPTGALDSRTSIEIMAIFQQLNREQGISMIVVTHEPDIAAYAKRIIHFRDGRIVADEQIAQPRQAQEELAALPAGRAGGGRMNMKKILASVRIALRALRINKLRSALTMLGIIIGVAAVIAMVAVGSGATARIQEQIASIGSNVIIVLSGSITSNGIRLGSGAAPDPELG